MPPRRRRRGLELGLILLLNELLQFGMRNIPPITLGSILGQTLLYMGIFNVPWEKEEVCISGNSIIREKDWRRLFLSAIEHGDDMHLYFNMASFLIKGRSLEGRYGSKNFIFVLLFLTIMTSAMYVSLAQIMMNVMESQSYMESCAIGFSGVIFALKVLTIYEEPYIRAMLLGIEIPGRYAPWVELIIIHMLVPNSSFMGHFAGILAGIIYTKTLFGTILDKLIYLTTGDPIIHGPNFSPMEMMAMMAAEGAQHEEPTDRGNFNTKRQDSRWNTTLYEDEVGDGDVGDAAEYSDYEEEDPELFYYPNPHDK